MNTRTFRTVIQRGKIQSPGTYRFAVFSYSQAAPCTRKNACVDAVPNRYPLIPLDHEAPSGADLDHRRLRERRERHPDDVDFDLTFSDDTFGTGVKSWVVQRKEFGTDAWVGPSRRAPAKNPTVIVPGDEGVTYRVSVSWRSTSRRTRGCRRTSFTTFAFDDRNPSVTYGGTTSHGSPARFLPLDDDDDRGRGGTATFSFFGASPSICVMGGPVSVGQNASVSATLDGNPVVLATESDTTVPRERVACLHGNTSGSHTLVLTVTSAEGYVIDGYCRHP